jgi:hypothetical protein
MPDVVELLKVIALRSEETREALLGLAVEVRAGRAELTAEMRAGFAAVRDELRGTNERIDGTNERIDRLLGLRGEAEPGADIVDIRQRLDKIEAAVFKRTG